MEFIVDTNVLVYDTIEDSDFHEEVKLLLSKASFVLIPSIVLIEYILVLKKLGLSDKFIAKRLNELLEDNKFIIVPIKRKNFKEALKIVKDNGIPFKEFNDKLILSIAKELNLPILTYDKELIEVCSREGVKILKCERK
ncbi:MAG: hypothetical protein DRN04_01990 [Thermoprotei archaeon]|nr:MAG: hypothetical protein DRN04_01990 [Thermoprotei archaeon]